MRTRFHRFLLMLLMLALPLQGFASAAMLGCMLSHPDAMQPMAMADDTMGCHEHEPADTPPAFHDCKHCAACVLAAALPIPAADVAAVVPPATCFTPQVTSLFSGFIPDGPERPPRPFLA